MRGRSGAALAIGLVLIAAASAAAQTAPPDLTGIWQRAGGGPGLIAGEPPMTAWGRERFDKAKPLHGPRTVSPTESTAAEMKCLPMGIPGFYFRPRALEIVQLPRRVLMLFEVDHVWREIHMDGRGFPDPPLHTWMGYSIGRYEGDTLVIETRHFIGWEENAHRWVDRLGHPFSDELIVTERLRRVDANTIENRMTINDPIAYAKPWDATMTFRRKEAGFEIGEFVCQELMLSELPFNTLTR